MTETGTDAGTAYKLKARMASGKFFVKDSATFDVLVNVERDRDLGDGAKGDFVVLRALDARTEWPLTDGLRREMRDAPPAEPCHVVRSAGQGYAIEAGRILDVIEADDAIHAGRRGRGPTPPVTEMIVDMPGQVRADDGRMIVPVWVSPTDIQASWGKKDGKGAPVGDVAYGAALNRYSDAAHQPVYDGDSKRTGEHRSGSPAMLMLGSTFGGAKHRRLWLDVEKVAALAHGSASGAHSLHDLVKGSETRGAAVEASRDAGRRKAREGRAVRGGAAAGR